MVRTCGLPRHPFGGGVPTDVRRHISVRALLAVSRWNGVFPAPKNVDRRIDGAVLWRARAAGGQDRRGVCEAGARSTSAPSPAKSARGATTEPCAQFVQQLARLGGPD